MATKKPKNQPEYHLQVLVCKYLRVQYPDILFMSDTIAQVKLTIPQQSRNKAIQKNRFKCPDLIIFEPNEKYNGLFIELKASTPYKKDGTLLSNEHNELQEETMAKLRAKGYYACFAWDFGQVVKLIKDYLNKAFRNTWFLL